MIEGQKKTVLFKDWPKNHYDGIITFLTMHQFNFVNVFKDLKT